MSKLCQNKKQMFFYQVLFMLFAFNSAEADWNYTQCRTECTPEKCTADPQKAPKCRSECSTYSADLVKKCEMATKNMTLDPTQTEAKSPEGASDLEKWIKSEEGYMACFQEHKKNASGYEGHLGNLQNSIVNLKGRLEASKSKNSTAKNSISDKEAAGAHNNGYKKCINEILSTTGVYNGSVPETVKAQDAKKKADMEKILPQIDTASTQGILFK